MLGVGQVYIEQARFEAGVLVPALDNVDSELYKSLNQEELEEISKGHGRDANAKLKLALKSVRPPTHVRRHGRMPTRWLGVSHMHVCAGAAGGGRPIAPPHGWRRNRAPGFWRRALSRRAIPRRWLTQRPHSGATCNAWQPCM